MDLQKGRLRQGGLNMSKMGRKITALMLALLMATSTLSLIHIFARRVVQKKASADDENKKTPFVVK